MKLNALFPSNEFIWMEDLQCNISIPSYSKNFGPRHISIDCRHLNTINLAGSINWKKVFEILLENKLVDHKFLESQNLEIRPMKVASPLLRMNVFLHKSTFSLRNPPNSTEGFIS